MEPTRWFYQEAAIAAEYEPNTPYVVKVGLE